jgi:Outer membrane lipoprotein-sorting protein
MMVWPPFGFAANPPDAMSLAQALFDRPNGRDVTTIGRMELIEKGKTPRVRQLVTYRLDRGRGETVTLIRFLEPKDIAGTGLLSVAKADGSSEQSLYLPELDRIRRVAGDRKGGRFVGSDLYFEDLHDRKPAKDRQRLIGKESIDGVPCEVLESVPIDGSDSVYRKRVSWIDTQTMMALRVDYFERDDATPSKRWSLLTRKRVQGYWTATDSRVADLGSGHETRLLVEQAIYDRKLPGKLFTPQALADEAIESEYRP